MSKRHIAKMVFLVLGDLLLLSGALLLSLYLRYHQDPDIHLIRQHFIPFGSIFLLWIVLFGAFGLYDLKFMKNGRQFLYRLLRVMATNTVTAIIIFYLTPFLEIEPRRNLFLTVFLATIFIFLWRYLFNLVIVRAPAARTLFLGITKEAMELVDFLLKNPQLGQKPIGFMSTNGEVPSSLFPLSHFVFDKNFAHTLQNQRIDTIVALREIKENKTLISALFQAIPLGIGVIEFPAYFEAITGKIPLSLIGEVWFLENLVGIKKKVYEFFKRGLDMAVAILLGAISLPLTTLIAVAILLDSRGPIFYRQRRVGRNGKEFLVVKFRSMVEDAEKMSGFKGGEFDPRHTRVGTFLRKNYLDEIPQIINILKGEMSFVGPRPERPEYVTDLKQKIPFYEMRLLVPPGITGWAQVNMENDASVEDAPKKMQYDLYYIKNRSFVLDLLIILRTIFIILRREGR